MYIVHNATDRTIILSDIRAEIGPRGIVDLEQITSRDAIDRSRDLQFALKSEKLQLGRHSVIRTKEKVVEPTIIERRTVEHQVFDEEKLAAVIRRVMSESPGKKQSDVNIGEVVQDAVNHSVGSLMDSIRDKINSIGDQPKQQELSIDPARFAELSQKSIEKISEGIETGGAKKSKKVEIINPNLKDLASEL